jgi:hypothetical protein
VTACPVNRVESTKGSNITVEFIFQPELGIERRNVGALRRPSSVFRFFLCFRRHIQIPREPR